MTTTAVPEFENYQGIYIPGVDYAVLPMDPKLRDAVPLFTENCSNLREAADRLTLATDEHENDDSRECGTAIAYGDLTENEASMIDSVFMDTLARRVRVRNLRTSAHHDESSMILWDYDRKGRHYTFGRIAGGIALASVAPIGARNRSIYRDGWIWSLRSTPKSRTS